MLTDEDLQKIEALINGGVNAGVKTVKSYVDQRMAVVESTMATKQDLREIANKLSDKIKASELEIRGEIRDVEDEFQTDFKKLKRRRTVTA